MANDQLLIVDDSSLSRMILGKLLTELRPQWLVDNEAKPAKAVEMMGKKKYTLVIADFNMPEVNGLEMVKSMRLINPDCCYCLLTANVQQHVMDDAAEQGVKFFAKPITEKLVVSIVDYYEHFNE